MAISGMNLETTGCPGQSLELKTCLKPLLKYSTCVCVLLIVLAYEKFLIWM